MAIYFDEAEERIRLAEELEAQGLSMAIEDEEGKRRLSQLFGIKQKSRPWQGRLGSHPERWFDVTEQDRISTPELLHHPPYMALFWTCPDGAVMTGPRDRKLGRYVCLGLGRHEWEKTAGGWTRIGALVEVAA